MKILKKATIALILLACLLLSSGCGLKKGDTMADTEAAVIEDSFNIAGTWIMPDNKPVLIFNEDGCCEDTKQKTKGIYQFLSGNASFTIADLFDEVHYISCQDKKGKTFLTGAVLGDLLSGYQENLRHECYYIRSDRRSLELSEILGDWKDINGNTYSLSLKEDGTAVTTDWSGSYDLSEDPEFGSCLTLHFENYDEVYAVLRYEKYLFLYRANTSLVYQLEPAS